MNDLSRTQQIFGFIFILSLSLLPLLSVSVPRFLGIGPAIIAVFGIAIFFFTFKTSWQFSRLGFLWTLFIIALAGLSTLWAVEPDFALERTGKITLILFPGLLLISLIQSLPANALKSKFWLFPMLYTLGVFLLCMEHLTDFQIYRLVRDIPKDEFVATPSLNRSVVTYTLCFFPALFTALNLVESPKRKVAVTAGLFLLIGICLVMTRSQSAQLAFLIGCLFFFFFPYKRKWLWAVLFIFIAALALSAPWTTHYLSQKINIQPETDPFLYEASIPQRLEIWNFTGQKALESPIYGHGIEATRFMESEIYMDFVRGHTILHPHSSIFQLWIEFGAIGILIGLAFLGSLFLMISNQGRKFQPLYLSSLMACLSVSFTGYGLWQSWWLGLLIVVATLCVLARRVFETPKQKPSIVLKAV